MNSSYHQDFQIPQQLISLKSLEKILKYQFKDKMYQINGSKKMGDNIQ